MELLPLLRTLGALALLLGLLAGALWVVRHYDLKLPGRVATGRRNRLALVERLAVDAKRSVALIRRDGCEHLILTGPDGDIVIESGIVAPAAALTVADFAHLVERAPAKRAQRARWHRAALRDASHA